MGHTARWPGRGKPWAVYGHHLLLVYLLCSWNGVACHTQPAPQPQGIRASLRPSASGTPARSGPGPRVSVSPPPGSPTYGRKRRRVSGEAEGREGLRETASSRTNPTRGEAPVVSQAWGSRLGRGSWSLCPDPSPHMRPAWSRSQCDGQVAQQPRKGPWMEAAGDLPPSMKAPIDAGLSASR